MGSEAQPLHVLFFPFMATGHMNPMVDIAKLFAARGAKATILVTPTNALLIQPTIDRANQSNPQHPIILSLVSFHPSAAEQLPAGCESFSSLPSLELMPALLQAIDTLRQPFDGVLAELRPDCVVTDMFFPWTQEVAAERGMPRLVFHGTSLFSLCATDALHRHKAPQDAEPVVLPGLPHRIEMLRSQILDQAEIPHTIREILMRARELEPSSYGVVVNSFHELEPEYVKHYSEVVGRRAWNVGPVSLCNKDEDDVASRGDKACMDRNECLRWLNSKSHGSVVYVCFGSLSELTAAQLREIALGLESSGRPFIWVVRRGGGEEWRLEGFEERIEGRGLVMRGWAPQILILNHPAVGGFVTHCGWNSSLEGVSAGVPMVTWPMFAEQFYNERLIVDVLGIGVGVGARMRPQEGEVVAAAAIAGAVERVMGSGEEAEGRRERARELGVKARRAVEEGGSSYVEMGNLINELLNRRGGIQTRESESNVSLRL